MCPSRPGGPATAPTFPTCGCRRPARCARPPVDVAPADTADLAYAAGPRARRRRPRGRPVGAALERRSAAPGPARDAEDTRLRRAHADRAAAEEDLVLHAVPRRGGDRDARMRWRCATATCAFPTYRQQGLLLARDDIVDGRADVPAAEQRARPDEGPPAAGDVFVQARRLLLDLRQPRDAVHPGGRLGDGLGDQGRHEDRVGLDRRRRHRRDPTSTPR